VGTCSECIGEKKSAAPRPQIWLPRKGGRRISFLSSHRASRTFTTHLDAIICHNAVEIAHTRIAPSDGQHSSTLSPRTSMLGKRTAHINLSDPLCRDFENARLSQRSSQALMSESKNEVMCQLGRSSQLPLIQLVTFCFPDSLCEQRVHSSLQVIVLHSIRHL
jgi:hypothetical protein